ncbi:MAG: N-6 DNA methylase [Bacteroidaceae bacterium]|nr:N-6 DNA methylase [Bacteroidaceae bacterium]
MPIHAYLRAINEQLRTGHAREHAYRPALQQLLQTLLPACTVTNEPARIACGAPDFIVTQRTTGLPLFFAEAKDIGDTDLEGRRQHREQFRRYRQSLDRIVFTDYLDFRLYEYGEPTLAVRLAELRDGKAVPVAGADEQFRALMAHLAAATPQRVTSPARLAEAMAAKARLLASVIGEALSGQDADHADGYLAGQWRAFRNLLIHDLTPAAFADIYAQTIAYGLFAARIHDTTPEDFSRFEAATLIPQTNPFLRKVFQSIATFDLDTRISWLVDDLVSLFAATDMERILGHYTHDPRHGDPLIHFYEDFLAAYDPALRRSRGVWYTPQPVVAFIVRAVDEILQREFHMPWGLAQWEVPRAPHLLDPATGTGTFLAEAIRQVHAKFRDQQGLWQDYVERHLLPRLNGFELLMASYAIAHLKLDLTLQQTGYRHRTDRRLRVFLTNSLEEGTGQVRDLFAQWLTEEANQANAVKRETPVMVMIGNPPYSGASQNKGEWIMKLMNDYKREPGGKQPLNERNPKWLNDDYVKFIRLGQHYIERNGVGVIGFINPHGYLDNPTFRGMRWQLLRTFDKIYTLDLHGNAKKKETCPDGSKDENVFDIMQGVSINLFVKTGRKEKGALGQVFHADLYGLREYKYEVLQNSALADIHFEEVAPKAPMYFFVPKDFALEEEYNKGFAVNELFPLCLLGPNSHRDDFAVCFSQDEAQQHIDDFKNPAISNEEIKSRYGLKDTRDWQVDAARKRIPANASPTKCLYRPFDFRYMLYGDYAFDYHRPQLNDNLLVDNVALIVTKQGRKGTSAFVASVPLGQHKIADSYDGSYAMPLYVLPSDEGQSMLEGTGQSLVPNFNSEVVQRIEKGLGEKAEPQELFDYIYAVLHSPAYRARYKEFLKIDFPRIPYPADAPLYHRLAALGKRLRELHTGTAAEAPAADGTTFPVAGSNTVEAVSYDDARARVYINTEQYFGGVSPDVWQHYIGGYQPAQKWLKDRRARTLSFDDIRHYQHLLHALAATRQAMREIDETAAPAEFYCL